jgi:Na+-transporting methylmalonyl-CoA/oxaloacetate decarboxylase gamma subunit
MEPMSVNWGEAILIAGKSFGSVFLILIILAVVTWLIGFVFQRIKRERGKAKSATEVEETKTKD